jgi:hypothetical protein
MRSGGDGGHGHARCQAIERSANPPPPPPCAEAAPHRATSNTITNFTLPSAVQGKQSKWPPLLCVTFFEAIFGWTTRESSTRRFQLFKKVSTSGGQTVRAWPPVLLKIYLKKAIILFQGHQSINFVTFSQCRIVPVVIHSATHSSV